MDQFLISRTSDSLNKSSIVETEWRCSLFTGLFVFTHTQILGPLAPFPSGEIARGSSALRWVPDPAPHLCKSIGAYGIPGLSNLLLLMEEHFLTNGFPMGCWLPTPSPQPKQEGLQPKKRAKLQSE